MSTLMTLHDVASLARVRRPVVTMWRKRSRGTAHPFPAPERGPTGQELFVLDDVVAWLEATERGNNAEVRADAAAHALWDGRTPARRRATAEVLSALLTLRHVSGLTLDGLDVDAVRELADEVDPDDECLLAEITGADDLAVAVELAESLVEATWGVEAAHERVLSERFRAHWAELAEAGLADEAHRLLATLTQALRRDLGDARLMDPTGAAVDALPRCSDEGDAVLLLRGTGPLRRLLRRQLLVRGVRTVTVEPEGGEWSVAGPVVHLVLLPVAGESGQPGESAGSAVQQLALVEEVALQMDDRQVAVVLGPARLLTDALPDAAASVRRDELLREGRVRAIVRLPAGLRPARAREHLGLWLVAAPEASSALERRTGVADLSSVSLSAHIVAGLTDDLLAARAGVEGARRRAWAHLVQVPTSGLVAGGGALVAVRRQRPVLRERSGADWVLALRRDDPGGLLDGFTMAAAQGTPAEVSLGHAVEQGWARVLPGHRVDVDYLPLGNVPVLGAEEVRGRPRGLRVDRLALAAATDARLTEPGDVVFTADNHPAAIVDAEGGALVTFPARVLRLGEGAPLAAASVVRRIESAAPGSLWKGWRLAVLPPDAVAPLGEALAACAAERDRLAARLAQLDALASDLTTAVEHRRITLERKEPHGARQG